MNAKTFLNETLRPVLMEMDMWSAAAEKLLLMTCVHESMGFVHKVQMGGGLARSYFQIKPKTLVDLYDNYLRYRPEKSNIMDTFFPEGIHILDTVESEQAALLDDRYSVSACRMIYSRIPEPLPAVDDNDNMARYWKSYFNTHLGKGTVEKFLND